MKDNMKLSIKELEQITGGVYERDGYIDIRKLEEERLRQRLLGGYDTARRIEELLRELTGGQSNTQPIRRVISDSLRERLPLPIADNPQPLL